MKLSTCDFPPDFLIDISNTLRMSAAEKIGVGITLLDFGNLDLKMKVNFFTGM